MAGSGAGCCPSRACALVLGSMVITGCLRQMGTCIVHERCIPCFICQLVRHLQAAIAAHSPCSQSLDRSWKLTQSSSLPILADNMFFRILACSAALICCELRSGYLNPGVATCRLEQPAPQNWDEWGAPQPAATWGNISGQPKPGQPPPGTNAHSSGGRQEAPQAGGAQPQVGFGVS